ncbi:hypothetical protein ABW20_dc0106742 [Dactylellina cionopaga]|nr:hypothetical protein ABW20_dc0106742 [Dactylellina cionopaga]
MSFQRYAINHFDNLDNLDNSDNLFSLLYGSVQWEQFSKGRQIAIVHRPERDQTPLVRTTTAYQLASQPFSPIHQTIIDEIKKASGIENLHLNHAMLEIYDSRYTTMGFHTDQALDLDPDSYICLFSCYENGADPYPRVLTVRNKRSEEEFEVQLLHHSVVVFSTATNQQHLHKIEGKGFPKNHDNRWVGLTLRLSKSFVKFIEGVPCLVSNKSELGELTIATEEERRAFFRYKGSENREIDFVYPDIRYTISPSDRMPVAY